MQLAQSINSTERARTRNKIAQDGEPQKGRVDTHIFTPLNAFTFKIFPFSENKYAYHKLLCFVTENQTIPNTGASG